MLSSVGRKRASLDGEEAMYALRRAAKDAKQAADRTREEYEAAQKVRKPCFVFSSRVVPLQSCWSLSWIVVRIAAAWCYTWYRPPVNCAPGYQGY